MILMILMIMMMMMIIIIIVLIILIIILRYPFASPRCLGSLAGIIFFVDPICFAPINFGSKHHELFGFGVS